MRVRGYREARAAHIAHRRQIAQLPTYEDGARAGIWLGLWIALPLVLMGLLAIGFSQISWAYPSIRAFALAGLAASLVAFLVFGGLAFKELVWIETEIKGRP